MANKKNIGITIEQLYNYLEKEIKRGHKDYKVFTATDEEGNNFTPLLYLGQVPIDMEQSEIDYYESITINLNEVVGKDKRKIVYLG